MMIPNLGMPLTDQQWNRLLRDIDEHSVVPVVGPEAVISETPAPPTTFIARLAQELAPRLEVGPQEIGPDGQLEDVVYAYLNKPRSNPNEPYEAVKDIITENVWPTPKPLSDIAGITSFDVFVCTTFDGFLERAIDDARFQGTRRTRTYSYCRTSQPQDVPLDYRAKYDSATPPEIPAVYYLFGRVGPLSDYSLREEDLLQCFHRMHFEGKRPQNLFDLLRARSLLLLGCNFPAGSRVSFWPGPAGICCLPAAPGASWPIARLRPTAASCSSSSAGR